MSSPSRQRAGRRAPARRSRAAPSPRPSSAAGRRTRPAAPQRPTRGRAGPAARARARPGTLRWMSALGSRSARSDGRSSPASRVESVSDSRHLRSRLAPPPTRRVGRARRRCPRRAAPPGASRAAIVAPRVRHLGLVVLTQHVERAHHHGGPSVERHLEPTAPERQRGVGVRRGRGDARRVDLDADHLDVGPHGPQPVAQVARCPRGGAVPEVDDDGVGRGAQGRGRSACAIQRSTRRRRLGWVVPRVIVPSGRGARRHARRE